jgi:hypothetical protein
LQAGLEVNGDDGQVQIDGSTPHLTLLRKQTIQTGTSVNPTGVNTSLGSVAVNPGEILAYRPQGGQWASVLGRNGNVVTFICTGAFIGIDCWIFSQHQPSGLNYGLQVFDGNQTLIYDTGRPIMNVLGSHDGTGGPTYWGNGNVAVIPWQTFASLRRFIQYTDVGTNPRFMAFVEQHMGMVRVTGNSVTTQNMQIAANASGPYDNDNGFPVNWAYDGNNGTDNRVMVIGLDNIP